MAIGSVLDLISRKQARTLYRYGSHNSIYNSQDQKAKGSINTYIFKFILSCRSTDNIVETCSCKFPSNLDVGIYQTVSDHPTSRMATV